MSAALSVLRPDWPAPAGVCAAFTLRHGGVSQGDHGSLNTGTANGDDAVAVAENRRRLRSGLKLPGEPRWLQQVHGTDVLRLEPQAAKVPPQADASYTLHSGVVCVIQVADCLPVLFCDRRGTRVAAAHAGWRGLAAGVLEATIAALAVPPGELMVWLGPCIGPQAFEVGAEVRQRYVDSAAADAAAFRPGAAPGKWLADLPLLARQRLSRAGVGQIYGLNRCTYTESQDFYSYRRQGRCGRMAALVWRESQRLPEGMRANG